MKLKRSIWQPHVSEISSPRDLDLGRKEDKRKIELLVWYEFNENSYKQMWSANPFSSLAMMNGK